MCMSMFKGISGHLIQDCQKRPRTADKVIYRVAIGEPSESIFFIHCECQIIKSRNLLSKFLKPRLCELLYIILKLFILFIYSCHHFNAYWKCNFSMSPSISRAVCRFVLRWQGSYTSISPIGALFPLEVLPYKKSPSETMLQVWWIKKGRC